MVDRIARDHGADRGGRFIDASERDETEGAIEIDRLPIGSRGVGFEQPVQHV